MAIERIPGFCALWRSRCECVSIVEDELQHSGLEPASIERTSGELAGLERALGAAAPGDLVVLFPHLERAGVADLLTARDARPVDERILRGYVSR